MIKRTNLLFFFMCKNKFTGGTTWKITNAPKEASIGMEFDDEEKLKNYIDFKDSL